ncbi:Uma2 family endonuclease [Nocardia vermiculata]|uniref:Uma2 family endonuclease n=1 Tax=Nocardia vermiculata TaxID=257274 RepID=A0A846XXR6_9NOCA|nr:Uma2 family endonuclease [Nocardia vermiculata]NKY51407.1 Uma2 family endonuclease [Nocardia vermiculata]
MPSSRIEKPDLPERLTWEELERLPDEVADRIELWAERVMWEPPSPAEHQMFTVRMRNAIESCARTSMSDDPETCWRVNIETNVFLGKAGKSDFLTPDFLVHRCLESPYQDVRATDTLLVGEVLSPSNTQSDMEAKKSRYAGSGIPWYWEVTLARDTSAIAIVRAYALETGHAQLPQGVRPLHPANYLLAGEWTPSGEEGVRIGFPFPITIDWSDLEY